MAGETRKMIIFQDFNTEDCMMRATRVSQISLSGMSLIMPEGVCGLERMCVCVCVKGGGGSDGI